METAMQELPLALFTTLAPIGAGAFIALAIAYATMTFSEEQLEKIDKMTFIPLFVVAVGFIASFTHLANPAHAFGALNGIGSSPLSNEIGMGVVFFIPAIVFGIMALTGKMKAATRKTFALIIAVLAVLFACFTGMAYYVDTIASWATFAVPVSIVGFCLMGGIALGSLVLALAGCLDEVSTNGYGKIATAVAVAGLVLGIAGVCMQYGLAASLATAMVSGAAMAQAVAGYLGVFVVLAVIGVAAAAFSLLKKPQTGIVACSAVAVIASVFLARLVFYALEISVGL